MFVRSFVRSFVRPSVRSFFPSFLPSFLPSFFLRRSSAVPTNARVSRNVREEREDAHRYSSCSTVLFSCRRVRLILCRPACCPCNVCLPSAGIIRACLAIRSVYMPLSLAYLLPGVSVASCHLFYVCTYIHIFSAGHFCNRTKLAGLCVTFPGCLLSSKWPFLVYNFLWAWPCFSALFLHRHLLSP